jgi:hypothetical protein
MKSRKRTQSCFFIALVLISGLAYAVDPEKDLQGVASPTDGYIKAVQFIVSIYQENSTKRPSSEIQSGTRAENLKGRNTESMRIADGQTAFIGTSQDVPIPVITAAKSENNASLKAVEYKKLESGVELRPHLMGRFVQLQIVEKNQHWNEETKTIETSTSHSVATLPLDQWTKVKGTLNDNEDIEDIYSTNRETNQGLWVKIELAPN